MDSVNEVGRNRKDTKCFAIRWTVVYVILFPFAFYMALWSLEFFDGPKLVAFVGLCMVFVTFWIPASMPASIYLMWSNFSRQKYKRTVFFGFLPWMVFVVADIIIEVLGLLWRRLG